MVVNLVAWVWLTANSRMRRLEEVCILPQWTTRCLGAAVVCVV